MKRSWIWVVLSKFCTPSLNITILMVLTKLKRTQSYKIVRCCPVINHIACSYLVTFVTLLGSYYFVIVLFSFTANESSLCFYNKPGENRTKKKKKRCRFYFQEYFSRFCAWWMTVDFSILHNTFENLYLNLFIVG